MRLTPKSRLLAAAAILLGGLAPSAPADDTEVADDANDAGRITIVAFGDSTTAPRGTLQVYSDLLQKECPPRGLPVRVVNAGVGGNHTEHARARFEKDVLAHDPDVVIIQFGINDAAVDVWKDPPATESRVSLAEFERNLRRFVQTLAKRRASVILMTPNPLRWTPKMRALYGKPPYLPNETDGFNLKLKDYAEAIRQIAKAEHAPLVDVYRSFETFGMAEGQSVDDLLLDGIHPNQRGHRLVADELLAVLLKPALRNAQDAATRIEVQIADNPAESSLSRPSGGFTAVRFEDYVSNPPPRQRDPVQGWVGQFATPFTGLAAPLASNTTAAPLPALVGLLVESSGDSVGFYDPSSQVDCAEARADKLIFRFVDPANTRRAATVSRVAFRATGTSVLSGKVQYRLYDLADKMLEVDGADLVHHPT